MTPRQPIVVDSFAGGGGASQGICMALGRAPDIAINHDKEAIALHTANHPESEHYAEDVWKVDPVKACRGRRVLLFWLSPDCADFSKAKGGKPLSKKIRGLAWVAARWAKAVKPKIIVLENVEEFQGWGPLLPDGRRDPERAGLTFRRFVGRLRNLGYVVEWRELRACDYGTPTIRKRLFLIARSDGQPIMWPKPTHGKGTARPWRTAAECIDWSLVCPSIFERKKPLAENTLRRIARGIRRFVIETPTPFIISYYGPKRPGDHRVADLAQPLPTAPTENRFGLVVPVIAGVGGRAGQSPERPLDKPYQTITSKADAALVAPYLVPTAHQGDARAHSLEEPIRTICGSVRGDHALVAPTLIQTGYGEDKHRNGGRGQPPRSLDLQQPLGTVVGGGVKHALVSSFLAKHYGGHETPGAQLDLPISTLTATDHHALVTSHLQRDFGRSVGGDLGEPMPTITGGGGGHVAEVRAFLTTYYGPVRDLGATLFEPMRTVTSRDRFGLVTVEGVDYVIADIGMRMLAPRELYRAQGFPDSYRIDIPYRGKPLSKTAQVRMCGNSVPPQLAHAIVLANITPAEELAHVA